LDALAADSVEQRRRPAHGADQPDGAGQSGHMAIKKLYSRETILIRKATTFGIVNTVYIL
jgi:hypothetical protein